MTASKKKKERREIERGNKKGEGEKKKEKGDNAGPRAEEHYR